MKAINVLMVGTGEYTTGYVNGRASDSDKSAGVLYITNRSLVYVINILTVSRFVEYYVTIYYRSLDLQCLISDAEKR